MATERLSVILQMQASQYNSEARRAATATGSISKEAKGAATQTGTLQKGMVNFGSVLRGAAVLGGVSALARGVGEAIGQAEAMGSQYAITEQVISQTGGAANVTAEEIKEMSRQQAFNTGVSKEMVTQGNNVLLTFKGIRNEVGEGNDIFDRTSDLMLDISATMGTDAKSAALQLGKALNDPVANMGALSRAGLTFSQTQKDQIKDLVANNDLLSAQKLILEELESQLGGTAEASADATDKMARAWDELTEVAGTALLPIVEDLADGLAVAVGMTPQVDNLADVIEKIGGINLSDTFQIGELLGVTDFEQTLRDIIETADLTDQELQELATGGMAQLREEFDLGQVSFGETGARAQILADIIQNELRAGLENSIGAANRHRGAMEDVVERIRNIDDQDLSDLQQEFIDTGLSIDEATEAAKLFETQLRRLTDPAFKALDNQRRFNEAVAALEEARAKGDPDELAVAIENAGQAYIDARESAAEFNRQDLDDAIGAMEATLLAAGATDDEVQLLTEHLRALDGGLSVYEIEANFRASGSAAAREAIESGGGFSQPTFTTSNRRQHGGPVSRNTPYLVGERGPELFIPNTSGQVVANNQLAAAVPAGPTIYVGTVYGFDDFSAKVRDAGINISRLGG